MGEEGEGGLEEYPGVATREVYWEWSWRRKPAWELGTDFRGPGY